jgi:hypothetical protein
MAQYIKYDQRPGGYIIGRAKGLAVTYELTPRGEAMITTHKIKDGDQVPATLLNQLRKMGDAFTRDAAPPGNQEIEQRQLPFS